LYYLIYQTDGNLVLYERSADGDISKWESDTDGQEVGYVGMQNSGNLVISDGSTSTIWATFTGGYPGAVLALEDNGILNIKFPDGEIIWSTEEVERANPHTKKLFPKNYIESPSGEYRLKYQTNGNLVLVKLIETGEYGMWSTETYGTEPSLVNMQNDGNLVVYTGSPWTGWNVEWSSKSGSSANTGSSLVLEDSGRLSIQRPDGIVIWSVNNLVERANPHSGILRPGEYIESPNGSYFVKYQQDGNLALYHRSPTMGDVPMWSTATNEHGPGLVNMQRDGNLVVYAPKVGGGWTPVWSSNTSGNSGSVLVLEDDGELHIQQPGGLNVWTAPLQASFV